jgi:hypothetical protein
VGQGKKQKAFHTKGSFDLQMLGAALHSIREKHENDLRKETKKLQRLREQIRTWIDAGDVRDVRDAQALIQAKKVSDDHSSDELAFLNAAGSVGYRG